MAKEKHREGIIGYNTDSLNRRVSKGTKVLRFINAGIVLACILTAIIPILPAGTFWYVAIVGLAFPYLMVILMFFIIWWWIRRSRWAFISLAALLINIQQLSVNIGWRLKRKQVIEKSEGSIRVLSWNVSRWDERNKERRGGTSFRPLMMDCIQMQEADVLCLQEFFECNDPYYFEANIPALTKMGYPYHYFFPTSDRFEGRFQYGMAIFSRFPIIDSAKFYIDVNAHAEGLSYADIRTSAGVFRVFSMHLQSVAFTPTDHDRIGDVRESKGLVGKMRIGYRLRTRQVRAAASIINASPYPVILCGDLNDVPTSFAYFKMKGKLQDAFLKKGSGIGTTYRFLSPTLRIDYIMTDRRFSIEQFNIVKVPYSDHYPIVTDMKFNP